ncbi:MAG: ornithine carbamoyltransferase [Bacteroidota bacterium]
MKKDFLSICDFSEQEILKTFELTTSLKAFPREFKSALSGKTLALIFEKPSLRTRVSFDVGIHQLGGFALSLLPSEINLGKRESIHDVAKNLERMVQGIMIRTFAHQNVVDMAKHASIPVINGLTDYSHPCQAMADYFTVQEIKGALKGLKLCFVGDGNNVAHSLLFAGARLGVHVTIACPIGYEPDPAALRQAAEDARATCARIEITHDPADGVKNADVVYTDVWTSMGMEAEAEERREAFQPFQVNKELMRRAKKNSIFMHCLPAHRGEEVTADVIDSEASVVFQQAENRLHVQKAIMAQLMK